MPKDLPAPKQTPLYEATLSDAAKESAKLGHSFVSPHHLLLALLNKKQTGIKKMLISIGVKHRDSAKRKATKEIKRKPTASEQLETMSAIFKTLYQCPPTK